MILAGRMPAGAGDSDVRLRRFSIRDSRFVLKGMGRIVPGTGFFSLMKLMRIFSFLYVVEIAGRPCGIFGIYNFNPGSSAEISLVIFDEDQRRRGFGRRIFEIGARLLRRHALVGRLLVTVDPANVPAAAFWKGLGFEDACGRGKFRVLSLELIRAEYGCMDRQVS